MRRFSRLCFWSFLPLILFHPSNSPAAEITVRGNGWEIEASRGSAFSEWHPELSRGDFRFHDIRFVHPRAPQESFGENDLKTLNAALAQRFRALFRCEGQGSLTRERFETNCRGEAAEGLRQALSPENATFQSALAPVFASLIRQHFAIDRVTCPLGQEHCRLIYLKEKLEGGSAQRSPTRADWDSPPFVPGGAPTTGGR